MTLYAAEIMRQRIAVGEATMMCVVVRQSLCLCVLSCSFGFYRGCLWRETVTVPWHTLYASIIDMRLSNHSTRFILIGTQHNENVGAAARAIKTMGFDDLALVSPRDIKVLGRHKVMQMSSGAVDVLRNAKIYTTLQEAIGDRSIICGTGMYHRDQKSPGVQHVEPRLYFDELLQARCYQRIDVDDYTDNVGDGNQDIRLALIFGSEQTGEPYFTSIQ